MTVLFDRDIKTIGKHINNLLKGFAFNQQIQRVETFAIETEKRVTETEKRLTKAENKTDFIVKTDIQKKEGFGSVRSFQRQFLDRYNMSPNDYRKSLLSIQQQTEG